MVQEWLYDSDNIIGNLTTGDVSGVLLSVDDVSGNILFLALYFGLFALLVLGYSLASQKIADGLMVGGFFMTGIGTAMSILGWLLPFYVFIAAAVTIIGFGLKRLIDSDERIVT